MITNLGAIRARHQWLVQQTGRELEIEAEAAGRIAATHVRTAATFKRRSGQLQDRTEHRVVRVGKNRVLLRVQNPLKYAAAIDGGAKPHMIAARRAQALRFVWKGETVFRRFVQHPGNKPYKFLYRATFAAYRVLGPNLEVALSGLAKKF